MKKYFISALAIAAIATACNVTIESESINPVDEYTLQIRGNIADLQNANTKTAITEDGSKFHSAWVNGDVIRVDVDGTGSKKTATYNSGTGLFSCSIPGLAEGDHSVTAAYPSSTSVSSSKYSFTVPTSQTMPAINAIDQLADFLVTQSEIIPVDGTGKISTVDMNFRRAVAIVKIIPVDGTTDPAKSLSGLKISRISISYPTKVNTKIKITPGAEDDASETSESSFSVSYAGNDFGFSANTSGTDGAYFVFAPGQFTKDKAITFSIDTDDARYTISKSIASLGGDITFGANQLRPITVTFTDADVTVDNTPAIVPETPEKLNADATSGSFTYDVTNPDGVSSVTAVKKSGDWISNVAAAAGTVTFDCTVNTGVERTAVITLSYPNAEDVDVTVTQKAPGAVESHVRTLYHSGSDVVQTLDGVSGGTYFSTNCSKADFSSNYAATSFTVNEVAYSAGLKMNSSAYITFTTSASLNSTVRFYAAGKTKAGTLQIVVGDKDSSTVLQNNIEAPRSGSTYGDSGLINLAKNTQYTIKRQAEESGIILVVVNETE